MNASPQGIGNIVPQLDADQVCAATAAARRLARVGIDARLQPAACDTQDWYLGTNFAFRPAIAKAVPRGAAAQTLVAILSDHAPVLDEIETATGHAAEFDDYGALPQAAAALCLERAGQPLGELVIHVALEDSAAPTPPALLLLEVTAARLPMADAQALEAGDLVILTHGPWPLSAAPAQCVACAFDPATGRLGAHFPFSQPPQQKPVQERSIMSNPQTFDRVPPSLTVPVVVRLADILLDPAEIAAMAAGGTVDLGPVAEGLEVTLSVGGRAIGKGAIVRLGDRFGVLLEEPAPSAAPNAPAGSDAAGQEHAGAESTRQGKT